jgi:hypothetical protein
MAWPHTAAWRIEESDSYGRFGNFMRNDQRASLDNRVAPLMSGVPLVVAAILARTAFAYHWGRHTNKLANVDAELSRKACGHTIQSDARFRWGSSSSSS